MQPTSLAGKTTDRLSTAGSATSQVPQNQLQTQHLQTQHLQIQHLQIQQLQIQQLQIQQLQIQQLQIQQLQIQENVSLAPYTTLRIGGPARFFAEVASEAGLLAALDFAREHSLPVFVIGGGSNLLVSDSGFPGLVLHAALSGAITQHPDTESVDFIVPAGISWDDLVLVVCQEGLSGMECLAGIPGLTGGTPVQNVGAYGQEVADTIHSVRAFDLAASPFSDPFVTLSKEDCRFSYRSSLFNSSARGRYIVTAVTFRLSRAARPKLSYADLARHFADRPSSNQPTPMDVYNAVREIRRGKGMLLVDGDPDSASAGSFFKNPIVPAVTLDRIAVDLHLDPSAIPHWPVGTPEAPASIKLSAAWLVEHAGFSKGYAMGRAGISSRHTLALINRGGATSIDVVALRDAIRSEVSRRFHISLEQEPVEPGAGTRLPTAI